MERSPQRQSRNNTPAGGGAAVKVPPSPIVKEIIGGDYKKLVHWSRIFGSYLSKGLGKEALTASQIRNVYTPIKSLEMNLALKGFQDQSLLILIPRLAYFAKRGDKQGIKNLKEVLTDAIDAVFDGEPTANKKLERFENLCRFLESILAYHKAPDNGQ